MADTYIPTAGIHIEDLPTTDTAKTTDGLIINSNNNTVNQISLGDLLADTDAKIQANTDLIDSMDDNFGGLEYVGTIVCTSGQTNTIQLSAQHCYLFIGYHSNRWQPLGMYLISTGDVESGIVPVCTSAGVSSMKLDENNVLTLVATTYGQRFKIWQYQ